MEVNPLQYPIGRFQAPEQIDAAQRQQWMEQLKALPEQLEAMLAKFRPEDLEKPYREGSWTARQVVHHLFDSHVHCYVRMKAALTEQDGVEIKDYNENAYAQLPDGKHAPVELSLMGLKALHHRWVYLLQSLSEEDWQKTYFHPTRGIHYRLDRVLGLYAWHGLHHLAHLNLIV